MLHFNVVTKAKRNTGASVTAAMLLFLVCAVVGAVVLTAGTAAAGRISRMAEMDQRYYSVTSAAELIAGQLTGKTVTVVRSKEYSEKVTKNYTVTLDAEGNESVSLASTATERSATYSTFVNGSAYTTDVTVTTDGASFPSSTAGSGGVRSDSSFLTARALKLLFGGDSLNTDAAMSASFASGHAEETFAFTLDHTSSAVSGDALGIKGTCTTKSDGTILIRLSDNGEKDNFVLIVTLLPEFSESVSTSDPSIAPKVTPSATGYTETTETVTTTTKTSSVKWKVGSIVKEVAQPDETP